MMTRSDLEKMVLGAVIGVITVEVVREKTPEVIKELKSNVVGLARSARTLYKEFETRALRCK
jgi:hypothetical protein